jgi:hypothetical protein
MSRFVPFAMRFDDEREAELVAEALRQLRCDNAPDHVKVARMRKMIDAELDGGTGQ